jgi:hypothetical protein
MPNIKTAEKSKVQTGDVVVDPNVMHFTIKTKHDGLGFLEVLQF